MKAVFLDRDGVINRKLDHDYVKCWDEFEFLPQSLAAICMLTEAEYQLIIVTNQACINKGIISHSQLAEIHRRMIEKIERTDGKICDIYYAPHRPDENSEYRKPKPGMLLQAVTEHNIDISQSYLIGDSLTDILAGRSIGCCSYLIWSGGDFEFPPNLAEDSQPNHVFENLYQATLSIVSES
ncbi:TPA: HAD family hydrolase [Candidatus Poribacteria bacterium]|nr:HAD family hydrolase [Candidatus Poribacteria bacterium]HIO77979.1 HAD family hydrolase [Candidatus Poribacteria bacterium]